MQSLRTTILGKDDLKFKDVPVPEWSEEGEDVVVVRVRGLTEEQVGAYQERSTSLRLKARRNEDPDVEVKIAQRRAELLVQCLFDPETDKRIFTSADAHELAKKNAGVIQGLHELATKLSGLDRKFDEQVKDAEADFSPGQS